MRKQRERNVRESKYVSAYRKKASLILNYQMCKAYFKDPAMSVGSVAERILRQKYNLPWQEKVIRKALAEVKGRHNAVVSIPEFNYERSVSDIIEGFVFKNLDMMVADRKRNRTYPLALAEILEKVS